ncbi:FecR domain-containing protein [bacterium]|nr:FecR domain-containing protein [bacterium]
MKILKSTSLITLVFLVSLTGVNVGAYDDQIGRVSHLDGQIYFQSGRSLDWLEGYMNSPVQEGDRIWTDVNSYAELQLDGSLFYRLDGDTKIDISRIGSRYGTISKVWLGSVYVRITQEIFRENPIIVDTPDGSIEFLTKGLYRIDVQQDNTSLIRVYEGVADVKLQGNSLSLRQGESLRISNGERIGSIMPFSRSASDDFSRYNDRRDELLLNPESTQYVDPSLSVGVYDLDYYGIWVYDASYGYCWSPRTFVGWVPYRFGRWVWVFPWGWTWVSLEPWGWLPYHYGYWYYSHYHGWMWKPDHYYGPAWVAWTAHSGSIGWVPLHPDDPPYYHWRAHNGPPNYTHFNSEVPKPRNASLHIGINASTHLSKESFESGKAIEKNTDILSLNREQVQDWGNKVPEEFKPIQEPATKMPSTTLREQSRAKTWTEERSQSRTSTPSRDHDGTVERGSGATDRSNVSQPEGRSPSRSRTGENRPSSTTRERVQTEPVSNYDRTDRPARDTDSDYSSPDRNAHSDTSRSSSDIDQDRSSDYQSTRSNFNSTDRGDRNDSRSEPSYRRPYDSDQSGRTNEKSGSSSSRGSSDSSNYDRSESRSSGSGGIGPRNSGSSSKSSGNSKNHSSGSKNGDSSSQSSKDSDSSGSSDSSSSKSTRTNSSRGFH